MWPSHFSKKNKQKISEILFLFFEYETFEIS